MNSADKKTGVRAQDPGMMLLELVEKSMRWHIERKRQSSIAKGQVPPNVKTALEMKKDAFKPLKSDFIDTSRTRVKFTLKAAAAERR